MRFSRPHLSSSIWTHIYNIYGFICFYLYAVVFGDLEEGSAPIIKEWEYISESGFANCIPDSFSRRVFDPVVRDFLGRRRVEFCCVAIFSLCFSVELTKRFSKLISGHLSVKDYYLVRGNPSVSNLLTESPL